MAMSEATVILRGVEVELSSDIGHQFVVDCTRAAEGLFGDKELAEIYEISPADWQNIVKNAALGRAIRAERDRRVLNGTAVREAAGILSKRRRFSIGLCLTNKQTCGIESMQSKRCAQLQPQKSKIAQRRATDSSSKSI
jgi:hypothetical protein